MFSEINVLKILAKAGKKIALIFKIIFRFNRKQLY